MDLSSDCRVFLSCLQKSHHETSTQDVQRLALFMEHSTFNEILTQKPCTLIAVVHWLPKIDMLIRNLDDSSSDLLVDASVKALHE